MSYREYLQSNHWQNVRKEHYSNQSNSRCIVCGGSEYLNVHHITYRSRTNNSLLYKENPSCLITLCETCHTIAHKYFTTTAANIRIKRHWYVAVSKEYKRIGDLDSAFRTVLRRFDLVRHGKGGYKSLKFYRDYKGKSNPHRSNRNSLKELGTFEYFARKRQGI